MIAQYVAAFSKVQTRK